MPYHTPHTALRHTPREGFKHEQRALPRLLLLLVVVTAMAPLDGRTDIPVFREATNPRELANILYPPRYRSIVLPASQAESAAGAFGLMINFEFDSTAIRPESLPLLASVGDMLGLKRVRNHAVLIEGHTDTTGSDEYNQRLSERRAQAIKRYLVDHYDVDPSRLKTKGVGERSLHDRTDPEGAINRRVQFRAVNGDRS